MRGYGSMTEDQIVNEYVVYYKKLLTTRARTELLLFLKKNYPRLAPRIFRKVGQKIGQYKEYS